MATIEDFDKLDIRVWKIINVENFPLAKKPAYKLTIDFWKGIWIKKSSAQLTQNYKIIDLIWKKVICVVNLHPRQIWPFISQVLTLWVPDNEGACILVEPEKDVPIWWRLY